MGLSRHVDLLRFRREQDLVDLADRARDGGQWEPAARFYRKALDRNPLNPSIWVQYGHALKESGELRDPDQLAQAERAYRKALSLDPSVADTHLQLGHVLKLQGRTEEAQAAYLRAAAADPPMPYALEELAGLGWSEAQMAELRTLVGPSGDPVALSPDFPVDPGAANHDGFDIPAAAPARQTDEFLGLRWQFSGDLQSRAGDAGYYKLLLVSHAASRTGAPLILIRLLEELTNVRGIECRVLIHDDGELTQEFARLAPTLRIDDAVEPGSGRRAAVDHIARLYRRYANRCVAVCNTVVTADYADAFDRNNVPVLAWIHELPTSIETFFGGASSVSQIRKSARRILCPSQVVRASLVNTYELDPAATAVIHYGTVLPDPNLVRREMRSRVRAELGISEDALIVLGCGTVDTRKGADLFVLVADRVIRCGRAPVQRNVAFVWVGDPYDDHFRSWVEHDVTRLGLQDRIIFTGPRADASPYFAAADVFVLSSREDPFPMVSMEALAHALPVVAFADGGGATEMLGERRGLVIPYLDLDGMAQAVISLLADEEGRHWQGVRSAAFIAGNHTWKHFADHFICLLKEHFDYFPPLELKVSVIIPNYNYSEFLDQRLSSILSQTRRPDEIVFLDDASEDDSVEVAKRYAIDSPVPFRIITNEENSGSAIKQWSRGLEAVSGDLVWIAEADDWCEPDFLERIIPEFYDISVQLAFSQSAVAGPKGEVFAPNYLGYTDAISKTHWQSWYSIPGEEEISLALSQKNTIPNASAVVFRRPHDESIRFKLSEYRLCHDWWFYSHAIRNGKISFVPQVLNYHRRHGQTVTHNIEKEDRAIEEALSVKQELFTTCAVPKNAKCRSIAHTLYEYYRLSELHGIARPDALDNPALAGWLAALRANIYGGHPDVRLRILTVLPDVEVGGGQIAGIRLANAIARTHESFLLNARPDRFDPHIASLVEERVVLLEGTLGPTEWSLHRGDGPNLNQLAEGAQRIRLLGELIRFHGIDAILSHVWWADRLSYAVVKALDIPWLLCMHGCYEALVDHPDWDPAFEGMVTPLLRAAAGVIYSTTRNLVVFDRFGIKKPPATLRLFHGFDPAEVPKRPGGSLRRGSDEFVFCLCSRAIAEKGWQEAIEAVLSINALPAPDRGGKRARLILVGGGPYADTLAAAFADREEVEFRGQLSRVVEIVAQCDVGLLPSRFVSESLPSTIMEYLACGIPVVTTDNGAIGDMVAVDGRDAALVLPLRGTLSFESCDLAALMLRYMTDPGLYAEHKANARYVFDRLFDASYVAEQFLEVIRSILEADQVAEPLRARAAFSVRGSA
jgi:glycosyltransferase involved in cell wall biosynthesis